jgi:hypothetical protein
VFSDVWLLSLTDPVWRWQEVAVRNPQWAATHMWCHPACKVLFSIKMYSINKFKFKPFYIALQSV